jgi:FkbM family methyltransferase
MPAALTSLSPARAGDEEIEACIRSWKDAGLDVVAFNHPDEIPELGQHYDVRFVPVEETTEAHFGRRCVAVSTLLRWAAEHDTSVLIVNSDLELALAPWELERLRSHADGGLCYLVRHNHAGVRERATRESWGIDAFLFHGRDGADLPPSFLSLGQPFWDYWLPCAFERRGLPLRTADFPAAFHRSHANRWSWETWMRCAAEFARVTGEPGATDTYEACQELSRRVRARIDAATFAIPRHPGPIRDWVESKFGGPEEKVFLELGAHQGTDTAWLAALPGVTLHAFEPDPRNAQAPRANVTVHRAAVCDRDGRGPLILSREGWGREWTHSSSLRRPKNHLLRFPVTFGDAVEVDLVALDTFARAHGVERVDFLWADVQGAEADVVRGGLATLRKTRYLYTEYSNDELYEGQATLAELLALLPDFRVLELWPDDVLLENRRLAA